MKGTYENISEKKKKRYMHDTQNKLGHPRARHAWRQLHPYTNLHGYMGLNASTATLTSRKKKRKNI